MAIAEMKRVSLVGLNKDREKLLREMQKLGCVEISPLDETEAAHQSQWEQARKDEANAAVERLDAAVVILSAFEREKKGMFAGRPVADAATVKAILLRKDELMSAVSRLEELERARGELKTRMERERALVEQMKPWRALTIPLEQICATKSAFLQLLTAPEAGFSTFTQDAAEISVPMAIEELSKAGGNVNALIAYHGCAAGEVESVVKSAGALTVRFEGMNGTPEQIIRQCETEMTRVGQQQAALNEEEARLADELKQLRILRDVFAMERDRLTASENFWETKNAFFMTGWAPTKDEKRIFERLKEVAPTTELEFRDPTPEEKPPTMLDNKPLVEPFESVIRLYSLPDPRGIDATALIVPFYVCFFGFMVSDAGYGVVMSLLCALYLQLAKPRGGMAQMAKVLFWGGLGTTFWGVMFGGWFGIETTPVMFSVLNDPISTMVLCMGLGFVHILFGLCVAAYMNIKRKRYVDALIDQGSWLLILLGVPLLILVGAVGKYCIIVGTAMMLLFGGRGKGNIFKCLLSGAGKLYGVTSYLSDILSYVRLFGMGLATGVIGMVINLLAGILMTGPVGYVLGAVVLLIGHTFNLGINALGAYVNACRLQYIEFFGKFYEDGGVAFKPLARETKYVDIDG